jgi:hypothetical protein
MNKIIIGGNKVLIAGGAAVKELETQLLEYSRVTLETDDVLVFLGPEDTPIVEVKSTETATVLVCEPETTGKGRSIVVFNGNAFRASIDRRPSRGGARLLTKFTYGS